MSIIWTMNSQCSSDVDLSGAAGLSTCKVQRSHMRGLDSVVGLSQSGTYLL